MLLILEYSFMEVFMQFMPLQLVSIILDQGDLGYV
jgi:hypothetical protein